jgi:hypothetical protein
MFDKHAINQPYIHTYTHTHTHTPKLLQVYMSSKLVPFPRNGSAPTTPSTSSNNALSPLEMLVDFTYWVAKREFLLRQRMRGGSTENSLTLSRIHAGGRVSRPVFLKKGEFRYMEAYYRSFVGGDNVAIAAKVSVSTVNRRDSPFGIDEQQLIQVSGSPPSYEVHTFSLLSAQQSDGSAAPFGGRFRVKIGGKLSREVPANASEAEFLNALNELFSDCEGTGAFDDGGGSSFNCWQAQAFTYRGLVSLFVYVCVCVCMCVRRYV